MKTILHYLSILLFTTLYVPPTTVYVCGSDNGKKFHLKDSCRGLKRCESKIFKTTMDKAKKDGKTLCKWED